MNDVPRETKEEKAKDEQAPPLKWILNSDLRLITEALLRKNHNPEIEPEAFYASAQALLGNPFLFCVYGTDEKGVIRAAVTGSYNPLDRCVYVKETFGIELPAAGLKEALTDVLIQFNAQKVKDGTHAKTINLEDESWDF